MWSNENVFFIQVEIGNNFINRSMIQTSSSELSAITSVTWSSGNLICAAQTATTAGPNVINIKSCVLTHRQKLAHCSQVLQAFTCWMCLVRFIFLCKILMHFLYLLFLFYLKFSLNLQPRVQTANTGNKRFAATSRLR